MTNLLWIGFGGFIGSISRYILSQVLYRAANAETFPYGTLGVNILGCFLIGFFAEFFEGRFLVQPELRLFLIIGVLGGFTTFSSFSFETFSLIREGNLLLAGINILASVVICLIATWLGTIVGKMN